MLRARQPTNEQTNQTVIRYAAPEDKLFLSHQRIDSNNYIRTPTPSLANDDVLYQFVLTCLFVLCIPVNLCPRLYFLIPGIRYFVMIHTIRLCISPERLADEAEEEDEEGQEQDK